MGDTQDEIAELTERIASILELPDDEQPDVFQRLRDEHPESRAFLIRCEDAASRLTPGCGLRASLVQDVAASVLNAKMPERIGPYKILEVLGEGGMGTVYLAEQKEPVRRRVALKVIKLGMATKEVIARFEAERQALALMDHPNITHVLDVGVTAEGRAYFAMEHVPGIRITDYCNRNQLGLEERIELFQEVCGAVQHAHQKCVLHRDLKPGNILVRSRDGKAVPTIIDFGVAKATDHRLTERSLFTEQGHLIGTPAYMSPEQAEMTGLAVDARADIYSLGVILYELLTGLLPFGAAELQQAGLVEIQRRIREDEPPKPSTRLTTNREETKATRKHFQTDPGAHAVALRGDLDWITMRCLEKDPNRRYPSASELAADLRRHLAHEPVDAGPPSAWYSLRKFLRRRRGSVAAVIAISLSLVASIAIAIWQANAADAAGRAEATERRRAADALVRYQQLKDAPLAEDLVHEAEHDLWPAHPDKVDAMASWIDRAKALVSRAATQREKLNEFRSKARPATPAVQRQVRALKRLERELDAKRTGRDKGPVRAGDIQSLEAMIRTLDAEIREKRWQFEDYEDRFLHAVFTDLVANIDRLVGEAGLLAQVVTRRNQAATLRVRSLEEAKEDWERAIAAIADSEMYADMPALTPQLGLLPLGTDPESKLEEFAVLDTGAVPQRDANGLLQIEAATAIVLVLIPPGTFAMGEQSSDPQAPNYDPAANRGLSPVHEVTLDAFFLSKYEMTQGQWRRVMGTNPSYRRPGLIVGGRVITAQNPVESVSLDDCSEAMRRAALALPTEAQWEYAARAGTATLPRTQQEGASRDPAENLAGKKYNAEEQHAGKDILEVDLTDGHAAHAPVGSFPANAFGLHDMIGNVMEKCRDVTMSYRQTARPGDGLRADSGHPYHIVRGCSFGGHPASLRRALTRRVSFVASTRTVNTGLRPSRVVMR